MQKLSPRDETEIADIVRAAADGASFEIVSGGSKRNMGRATEAGTPLDVSALSGIVAYEPDELVLTVRAATTLTEVTALLASRNQMLGFAPADWGPLLGAEQGSATMAGIVGSNSSGARRVKAGAVRDHLIGARFVNGAGEIIKAGGRVVKNVTGFDIAKLMAGAFGTLGVLTELTFRVVPAPQAAPVVALRDCTPESGLQALRDAASLPLEATGLAYLPSSISGPQFPNGVALIRVEGSHDAVADKTARLMKAFVAHDPIMLAEDTGAALFREIDNGGVFRGTGSDLWRLCVPTSASAEALSASGATNWYADWAGGLLWLELPATESVAAHLRAITAKHGGHAMLMRAAVQSRKTLAVFEPEPPARAGLTRSIKAAFDPKHVLNPGRMYEDL